MHLLVYHWHTSQYTIPLIHKQTPQRDSTWSTVHKTGAAFFGLFSFFSTSSFQTNRTPCRSSRSFGMVLQLNRMNVGNPKTFSMHSERYYFPSNAWGLGAHSQLHCKAIRDGRPDEEPKEESRFVIRNEANPSSCCVFCVSSTEIKCVSE